MKPDNNPFQYEAANNLTDEMVAEYYIDDFNYSRFIQSKRNVFLVGERGSGKTMALLFNRWRVQRLLAEKKGNEPSTSTIGVYMPCNTPLTHKAEHQLVENFLASVLSEHFFVLSLVYSLADTLSEIPNVLGGADESSLRKEASFVLGGILPEGSGFFESIKLFVQRELLQTQRVLNSPDRSAFYENTFSFISAFVPILNICSSQIPKLKQSKSHFLLLIDDAHSLNEYQVRALNSWIAYRDHSLFSFKVAIAKVSTQTKITSSGGSILEGHDYTEIDLEAPYQNKYSNFYNLAQTLIQRRLEKVSIHTSPEKFFPINAAMEKQLKMAEQVVREEAIRKYGEKESKSVTDYIYKYKRAYYFRNRPARANRPPYSGFETLVFLSTGVIRNLLEPCFWMYDNVISKSNTKNSEGESDVISSIPSSIQTKVILERSQRTWAWLKDRIAQDIEDCSTEDGQRAYRLLDALAVHFRDRLLYHESEPRALSFTISQQDPDIMVNLDHLIEILRKAQLLYIRSGSSKDDGKRETYYVPNRILWPSRGLDPHGQHARISIPASSLWDAAERGKIAINQDDEQRSFWDDG